MERKGDRTGRTQDQQEAQVVLIGNNQSILGVGMLSMQGACCLPWDIRSEESPGWLGWLAKIAGCGRILAQSLEELQLHPMHARLGLCVR